MTQDGCAAIPAACAADRNTTGRHHDNYNGGATLTDPSSAGFNPIQWFKRKSVPENSGTDQIRMSGKSEMDGYPNTTKNLNMPGTSRLFACPALLGLLLRDAQ